MRDMSRVNGPGQRSRSEVKGQGQRSTKPFLTFLGPNMHIHCMYTMSATYMQTHAALALPTVALGTWPTLPIGDVAILSYWGATRRAQRMPISHDLYEAPNPYMELHVWNCSRTYVLTGMSRDRERWGRGESVGLHQLWPACLGWPRRQVVVAVAAVA